MIVTVDTSKDSPAQLRKAARLLEQLAGDAPARSETVEPTPAMMGMFSADNDTTDEEPLVEGSTIIPY